MKLSVDNVENDTFRANDSDNEYQHFRWIMTLSVDNDIYFLKMTLSIDNFRDTPGS